MALTNASGAVVAEYTYDASGNGNPITMNGYNYSNNNPVMNVDPGGEYWKNAFWNKK